MFFYSTDAGISSDENATSGKRHCPFCEYTCIRPGHMKKHIRIHTGEEPYQCTVCMKGFKQKCNLNSHMRNHTGDRPFGCPHCGKTFVWSSGRKAHLKIHHPECISHNPS
ncbi:hypothetical protein CEXT_484491 [Caerostris extrusa]|uniref:C2H2-type domain-containing protein n=1 Tax=Caerostris extrusa TaxID=172846 RepID=A0AAV4Y5I4_CAEEX|nr:hypothetical protein CEXT_484491 [Caerostris extrusa]